jgi:hypothetical protein
MSTTVVGTTITRSELHHFYRHDQGGILDNVDSSMLAE